VLLRFSDISIQIAAWVGDAALGGVVVCWVSAGSYKFIGTKVQKFQTSLLNLGTLARWICP
jgi:hypothetical protein